MRLGLQISASKHQNGSYKTNSIASGQETFKGSRRPYTGIKNLAQIHPQSQKQFDFVDKPLFGITAGFCRGPVFWFNILILCEISINQICQQKVFKPFGFHLQDFAIKLKTNQIDWNIFLIIKNASTTDALHLFLQVLPSHFVYLSWPSPLFLPHCDFPFGAGPGGLVSCRRWEMSWAV